MALIILSGAANTEKRYRGMDCRIDWSKVHFPGRLRALKVQELSLRSSLEKRSSQEIFLYAFWIRGAPRDFEGSEPFWKPKILTILRWAIRGVLKRKKRSFPWLITTPEASKKVSRVDFRAEASLVEGWPNKENDPTLDVGHLSFPNHIWHAEVFSRQSVSEKPHNDMVTYAIRCNWIKGTSVRYKWRLLISWGE